MSYKNKIGFAGLTIAAALFAGCGKAKEEAAENGSSDAGPGGKTPRSARLIT